MQLPYLFILKIIVLKLIITFLHSSVTDQSAYMYTKLDQTKLNASTTKKLTSSKQMN